MPVVDIKELPSGRCEVTVNGNLLMTLCSDRADAERVCENIYDAFCDELVEPGVKRIEELESRCEELESSLECMTAIASKVCDVPDVESLQEERDALQKRCEELEVANAELVHQACERTCTSRWCSEVLGNWRTWARELTGLPESAADEELRAAMVEAVGEAELMKQAAMNLRRYAYDHLHESQRHSLRWKEAARKLMRERDEACSERDAVAKQLTGWRTTLHAHRKAYRALKSVARKGLDWRDRLESVCFKSSKMIHDLNRQLERALMLKSQAETKCEQIRGWWLEADRELAECRGDFIDTFAKAQCASCGGLEFEVPPKMTPEEEGAVWRKFFQDNCEGPHIDEILERDSSVAGWWLDTSKVPPRIVPLRESFEPAQPKRETEGE